MKNKGIHSSLMGIVGGYLIYLAWELFDGMRKGTTTMAAWVNIFFILLFLGAGVAVLIYAWKDWQQQKKKEDEEPAGSSSDADILRKE